MWKSLASNTLTVLGVLLFLLAGLIYWSKGAYERPGPLAQAICIEVPRGSSFFDLSEQLSQKAAITHERVFRLGVEYNDLTPKLKAGNYLIPEQASMADIADIVTRGGADSCGTEILYRFGITQLSVQIRDFDAKTRRYVAQTAVPLERMQEDQGFIDLLGRAETRHRIAMAEGITSAQVVKGLSELQVLEGAITTPPAEGSLAPGSYEIRSGLPRSKLIERMQARQAEVLQFNWQKRASDLPLASANEALILASIVEKETGLDGERGLVASVFINRLRKGMRLQTDPTVIYGITQGKAPLGRGLRRSELDRPTPWNTYVIDGLPPTPIANPGEASIRAVLDPPESAFLFFVADGSGGHAFAKTLADHNANVRKWRAFERKNRAP